MSDEVICGILPGQLNRLAEQKALELYDLLLQYERNHPGVISPENLGPEIVVLDRFKGMYMHYNANRVI